MNLLIMLLLLEALQGNSSMPINASMIYIGSAFSITVYQLSFKNVTGYLMTPQGIYEGTFVGLLKVGNLTYIGTYHGLISHSLFIGYFTPIIAYESVSIPTVLMPGNYTGFEAIAQSKVPVYLRYLVFNEYSNGTLVNTLSLISVNTTKPPLTIWFNNGYDCVEYSINITFNEPMKIIPIPVIVNTQPPISYFVSNVSIIGVYPQTELTLLEPGDVVVAESPISEANYTMYVCRKIMSTSNSNFLYVIEYLGPTGISLSNSIITRIFGIERPNNLISVVNRVFYVLTSGRYVVITYSVGPNNLLNTGKGSIIDFTALAMAVLRSYGIPTRVVLGFYGVSIGNNTYVFSPETNILWDESFVNGWVMFTPYPIPSKSTLGVNLADIASSVIVGLALVLPWIIGYLIYVLISHVRAR
ncbi:transglutaminase-like domain-containing protein [Vulcanisaeta distributa]|uniref:Transglutaminase domain protein n=1 Tax=Vulcanisaeta distributa (strain DSM 14429 / JCM 11212 / NBRC 100878 / IC-017) TaxID=572478 RepID=E1QTU0_VULDI|nr:transglutaminase-like domain-containing protein [Vulcanisaeta distributa]ADN51007.1 transglutaminase domain protein [Vulcanisaeta distributa DSM 14429]